MLGISSPHNQPILLNLELNQLEYELRWAAVVHLVILSWQPLHALDLYHIFHFPILFVLHHRLHLEQIFQTFFWVVLSYNSFSSLLGSYAVRNTANPSSM